MKNMYMAYSWVMALMLKDIKSKTTKGQQLFVSLGEGRLILNYYL